MLNGVIAALAATVLNANPALEIAASLSEGADLDTINRCAAIKIQERNLLEEEKTKPDPKLSIERIEEMQETAVAFGAMWMTARGVEMSTMGDSEETKKAAAASLNRALIWMTEVSNGQHGEDFVQTAKRCDALIVSALQKLE